MFFRTLFAGKKIMPPCFEWSEEGPWRDDVIEL